MVFRCAEVAAAEAIRPILIIYSFMLIVPGAVMRKKNTNFLRVNFQIGLITMLLLFLPSARQISGAREAQRAKDGTRKGKIPICSHRFRVRFPKTAAHTMFRLARSRAPSRRQWHIPSTFLTAIYGNRLLRFLHFRTVFWRPFCLLWTVAARTVSFSNVSADLAQKEVKKDVGAGDEIEDAMEVEEEGLKNDAAEDERKDAEADEEQGQEEDEAEGEENDAEEDEEQGQTEEEAKRKAEAAKQRKREQEIEAMLPAYWEFQFLSEKVLKFPSSAHDGKHMHASSC